MPRDPKMDAAYFWTFPPKPQGGAKAQKMLPKVAGVKGGKRGAQRSIFQMTERKRKIQPGQGLRRKASAHSEVPLILVNPQVFGFQGFEAAGHFGLKM